MQDHHQFPRVVERIAELFWQVVIIATLVTGPHTTGAEPSISPALTAAKDVFFPRAYQEAVAFFRRGGSGDDFRIAVDDACWREMETSGLTRIAPEARVFGAAYLMETVGDISHFISVRQAYTTDQREPTWMDGWGSGPVMPIESNDTFPCFNKYALSVGISKSQARKHKTPRAIWSATWHQKFAVEAYLPPLIALSKWGVPAHVHAMQANTTPIFQVPSATIVVHWPNCFRENSSQSKYCRDRVKEQSHTHDTWVLETHDWAECNWFTQKDLYPEEAKKGIFHVRNCNRWGQDTHILRNHGVVPDTRDRGSFTIHRDVVVPTSNGLVSPKPLSTAGEGHVALARRVATFDNAPDGLRGSFTIARRPTLAAMIVGARFTETGEQDQHGHGARGLIVDLLQKKHPDIKIADRMDPTEAVKMYATSRFCIQADGAAPWSPRLVEYMLLGCVPVLVSDTILPPFASLLDYSKFSVQVNIKDVASIPSILRAADYTALAEGVALASPFFRWSFALGTDHEGWGSALPLVVLEMYRRGTNTSSNRSFYRPRAMKD